jgi:hypothetical protein
MQPFCMVSPLKIVELKPNGAILRGTIAKAVWH